jgi:hypothetical protein
MIQPAGPQCATAVTAFAASVSLRYRFGDRRGRTRFRVFSVRSRPRASRDSSARSGRRPASPCSNPPPARPAAGRDPTDLTYPTAGRRAGGAGSAWAAARVWVGRVVSQNKGDRNRLRLRRNHKGSRNRFRLRFPPPYHIVLTIYLIVKSWRMRQNRVSIRYFRSSYSASKVRQWTCLPATKTLSFRQVNRSLRPGLARCRSRPIISSMT